MAKLPGLPANDFHNFLSQAARLRIHAALAQSELLRTRVLKEIENRYRSEPKTEQEFFEYCNVGKASMEIRNSREESARMVLKVTLREFKAAGKYGNELWDIMNEEIEAAVNSLELTTLQRDVLKMELDLHNQPMPEDRISESIWEQINVGLLRIEAQRLGGKRVLDCVREAYDLFVNGLAQGALPTEQIYSKMLLY